jgi:hypothetical protein
LIGNLQWTNDLVYFGFTLILLASAVVLAQDGPTGLRPLYGAAVLLPSALILSGFMRALWALRVRTGIGFKRSVFAFLNWLSLSWTVAIACVQGLTRSEGVFLRTPKVEENHRLWAALWTTRAETFWTLALWSAAVFAVVYDQARPFVVALFVWQGIVYASAPYMSWLNQHTELSAQLERRRRTESLRERVRSIPVWSVGALGMAAAGVAIAVLIGFGGSNPGEPRDPFSLPDAAASDQGPLTDVVSNSGDDTPSSTTLPTTPTTSGSPSTTGGSSGTSPPETNPPATTPPATSPPTPTTAP